MSTLNRPNYSNVNIYGTYPRKMSDFDMQMQQSATLDEYNFTPDPQQLRGILRKNREHYSSHPVYLNGYDQYTTANNSFEQKFIMKQVIFKVVFLIKS